MKKFILICAPVTSRSGYGSHSRDLVESLLDMDRYDIKILDVRWGDCPRNALDGKESRNKKIKECIISPNTPLQKQPDVYIDIRIPHEFQQIGKFNIGITAGVETNAVSGKWLEFCNKMDLVIVPSEHSKQGFVNSVYDALQQQPDGSQQKVGELKLEKPIEVLFEGADEDIYKPLDSKDIDSEFFDWLNDMAPEKFAFLVVGQWGKGNFGEDRKNIGLTIKTFYEAFANKKKQPALILKVNGANFSILDREDCYTKIRQIKNLFPKDWKLPNVYLLHGDLSDTEMNYLYNHPKIKAMVSFTHGEGFGRPLLEASMTGLPIIASGWSGQVDFLDKKLSILLGGELKEIPKSMVWENVLIEQSKWFYVNPNHAYNFLSNSMLNYDEMKRNAKSLMNQNREKFTLAKMTDKFKEILDKYLKNMPQQVSLNLPKLKKVSKNEKPTNKLKLPKLKKISGGKVI